MHKPFIRSGMSNDSDSHGRLSNPRSPIPESQARNIDYESERAINMQIGSGRAALFSGELFKDLPMQSDAKGALPIKKRRVHSHERRERKDRKRSQSEDPGVVNTLRRNHSLTVDVDPVREAECIQSQNADDQEQGNSPAKENLLKLGPEDHSN